MAEHLWVSALDGSGLRQLTLSSLAEDSPLWSPDGRWIAFRQRGVVSDGCHGVWVVPASATRVFVNQVGVPSSALRLRRIATSVAIASFCDYSGALSWFQ
jgi:hypothetical protein